MRWLVLVLVLACNRSSDAPAKREPIASGAATDARDVGSGVESQCTRFLAAYGAPASKDLIEKCVATTKDFATADLETCVRHAERSQTYSKRILHRAGLPPVPAAKAIDELVQCPQLAADATVQCVAGAKTDAEADKCIEELYPVLLRAASAASGRPEVVRELERMGELAKALHAKGGGFPRGTSPRTPARSCCESPTRLCPTVDDDWKLMWKTLGYKPAGSDLLYQYTYKSDGNTLTIEGLGDMDCDGTTVTYTLEVKADGQTKITKPPLGQD